MNGYIQAAAICMSILMFLGFAAGFVAMIMVFVVDEDDRRNLVKATVSFFALGFISFLLSLLLGSIAG